MKGRETWFFLRHRYQIFNIPINGKTFFLQNFSSGIILVHSIKIWLISIFSILFSFQTCLGYLLHEGDSSGWAIVKISIYSISECSDKFLLINWLTIFNNVKRSLIDVKRTSLPTNILQTRYLSEYRHPYLHFVCGMTSFR